MTDQKIIGVFGSAANPPGSENYENARIIGRLLAESNYAVLTGGYGGVMGGVSHGAAEGKGRVIGVTVSLFRQRGLQPNPWVNEEVELPTLRERLNYLVTRPEAFVVMNGGVGTLSEVALAWSLMQVREIAPRPMILFGETWRAFIEVFAQHSTLRPDDLKYLTFVDTVEAVIPSLEAWWAAPPTIPPRLGDVQDTTPREDAK